MTYYELLGSPGNEDLMEAFEFLEKRRIPKYERELQRERAAGCFQDLILARSRLLQYCHLSERTPQEPAHEAVDRISELAVFYLLRDWWEADKSEAKVMAKSKSNKELPWCRVFQQGLLYSLLIHAEERVAALAEWCETWLVPEPSLPTIDPLGANLYLVMASDFRVSPFDNVEDIEDQITNGRSKQPKLLLEAWRAVRANDRQAFEDAFADSVVHFAKTLGTPERAIDCIAIDQSIVLAAATMKGVSQGVFRDEIAARVLTAKSIGLE